MNENMAKIILKFMELAVVRGREYTDLPADIVAAMTVLEVQTELMARGLDVESQTE